MKPFLYDHPYPTPRLPVFARNVVATSHPAAAAAGLRMLWKGGNAVDAAIASAAAMTILEPVSNGLGSDAFCILWDGQQLHGLNASGRAPAAWSLDYFRAKYGADARTPPRRGWDSVTVPGMVAGWVAAARTIRQAAFCRSARARHRLCRARLCRAHGGGREVGRAGGRAGHAARDSRRLSCRMAARPRWASCSLSRRRRAACD